MKSYDDVTASVEKWLSEKAKITGEASQGLNEIILRAILINMMPNELRKHLKEHEDKFNTLNRVQMEIERTIRYKTHENKNNGHRGLRRGG